MDVKLAVAEKLATQSEVIKDSLINYFVVQEVERRSNILIKAVGAIDNLQKEIKKEDKPDSVLINPDGSKVSQYSEKKFQTVAGLKSKLEQIQKVFEDCLANNLQQDYDKLSGLTSGSKQENSPTSNN